MSKKYRKNQYNILSLSAPVKTITPYLAAILAFVLICLCSAASVKGTTVLLILTAFVAGCFRFKKLREQIRFPLIALVLVVLMDFLSTFYAVSGKFALHEFIKVLVSFAMAIILLALAPGEGENPGHHIASILARASALMGIVSIDLLSTRWISHLILGFLNLFGNEYTNVVGVEAGTRMVSMLSFPNVFAGISGIGALLSLSLVLSAERGKERMSHVVCLFINALAFVLAFSMGATGIIVVAFLVYLMLEHKERRAGLFILMIETLVITMVGVVLISMTSFDAWDGFQPIPMLCLIVGAAVLCLLDHFVGQRLAEKLANHGKALLIIIAGLLVVLLVGALTAYNLTGSADLAAGESLRRSVYPKAGEYIVTAETNAPITVKIESQNKEETMMHTSTVLYKGDLSSASFTVPDDSLVVYFNFSTRQDAHLEDVTFSGQNGEGEVPLGYKLLPGFIANRLQGLFANQNAIQRTVFFEDGIKLFKRSPVAGLGIGSYENGILGVQSFFYETKYAHNHYIQALTETGIIGLVLFLGLLIISAVAVLRSRRKENTHPLTPALGAALVFMAGHAAVEVVFSYYAYLPFAFGVFALINMCCADTLSVSWLTTKVKTVILAGIAAILAIFFVLLCGNMSAAKLVKEAPTFDSLEQAIKMDKYEWADYMLSYVLSSPNAPDHPDIQAKAVEYAARLEKVDSNTIPIQLAEFYFSHGNTERGMAMIEKYVTYVSSKAECWQEAFNLLQAYVTDSDAYRSGVIKIAQMLETWNAENMGEITLSEGTRAFLAYIGDKTH